VPVTEGAPTPPYGERHVALWKASHPRTRQRQRSRDPGCEAGPDLHTPIVAAPEPGIVEPESRRSALHPPGELRAAEDPSPDGDTEAPRLRA